MSADSTIPPSGVPVLRHAKAGILTARQSAAIAVLTIFGIDSATAMGALCSNSAIEDMTIGDVLFTSFSHHGKVFDQGLVIKRSETCFELHLHGGTAVIDQAILSLKELGVEILSNDTLGRLVFQPIPDPKILAARIFCEFMEYLYRAESLPALRLLAGQISAGLSGWIHRSIGLLQQMEVDKNAELWMIQRQAQWILSRWNVCRRLFEKPRLAIVGPANAGKSTLANALIGQPGSIGSSKAGTTRDWIDAKVLLPYANMSIAVTLVDTAGIRETDDVIERESISRTREQMRLADLLLVVLDVKTTDRQHPLDVYLASLGIEQDGTRPVIVAINKIDLTPWKDPIHNTPDLVIPISALQESGLDNLSSAIWSALGLCDLNPADAVAWTDRQRQLLNDLTVATQIIEAVRFLEILQNG
jgi:small GTP-binding protein